MVNVHLYLPEVVIFRVEAANAASHTKDTYLAAKYHRLASIYNLLKTRQIYKDLGVNYIDNSKKQMTIRRYIKTLESLGVNVSIIS